MILLTCDHKKRELKQLISLKKQLENNGVKAAIINKHCIIKAYNFFKPKIIVVPHATGYLSSPIEILQKKVIFVLLPTEHCAFQDNLIKIIFFSQVKSHKIKNSFNLLDYAFTQSNLIKKYLLNHSKLNKNQLISSGHFYYNDWANTIKRKQSKIKKIGIALTNDFLLRRYKNTNFLKNLHDLNNDVDLVKNNWRLKQMNFDMYYFTIIYSLISKLGQKYKISLRKHTLDVETDFNFLNKYNVDIDTNGNVNEWIQDQDVIISTVSSINVDAYINKTPHISLMSLMSNDFFFEAYGSVNFKNYLEPNSFKPKSINELINNIDKYKFKKNKLLDIKLKKYFSYPYKIEPQEIILKKLIEIYKKNNKNYSPQFTRFEKKLSRYFGNKTTIFFSLIFSQLKIYLNKDSKNSFIDFIFFLR